MSSVRQVILAARSELEQHDIDDAAFNADCLAAKVLRVSNGNLPGLWEKTASEEFCARLADLVQRRCRHEPLQYLVGEWGFLDFEVQVGPEALIPRPETEDVFMSAADAIDKRQFKSAFKFADVGTGTGVLGIAMVRRFAGARGCLVDLSEKALKLAEINTRRFPESANRLNLLRGDLLASFKDASLQVVISNPPYIVADEVKSLQPEVSRFEPGMALDGGPTGLELIARMLQQAAGVLVSGGLMIFEHGHGQREALKKMLGEDWRLLRAGDDLGGRERFFILERK